MCDYTTPVVLRASNDPVPARTVELCQQRLDDSNLSFAVGRDDVVLCCCRVELNRYLSAADARSQQAQQDDSDASGGASVVGFSTRGTNCGEKRAKTGYWRDCREISSLISDLRKWMAESEGFEPPIALRLCLISSQVHSTGLCQLSVL